MVVLVDAAQSVVAVGTADDSDDTVDVQNVDVAAAGGECGAVVEGRAPAGAGADDGAEGAADTHAFQDDDELVPNAEHALAKKCCFHGCRGCYCLYRRYCCC